MKKLIVIALVLFVTTSCEQRTSEIKIVKDSIIQKPIPQRIIKNDIDFCDFKVKSPYSLIMYSDNTYGILFEYNANWFKCNLKETNHDFTTMRQEAEHFKDSCDAKKSLFLFFESQKGLDFKKLNK